MSNESAHEADEHIDEALLASWAERYMADRAVPRKDKPFASIETSLVLEPLLATSLKPDARRMRICLPSLGKGKAFGRFEVSGADLERWGVWSKRTDFVKYSDWYPLVRYLAGKELLEDLGAWLEQDEFTDPRERRPRVPRRQVRLRELPLLTNRRRPATKYRSNETLREGVGTFVVPKGLFVDDRLSQLSIIEFMTLMTVYALTDMATFGGADPAHIRVEEGCFECSEVVWLSVPAAPHEVLAAALSLEQSGFLRFVPVELSRVLLPSAWPTYEVRREDASSSSFVLRPTTLNSKHAAPLSEKSLEEPLGGPEISVRVDGEWPLKLVATIPSAVPQVPQYSRESYASVVADRAVQNFKMRLTQALEDSRFHSSDISMGIADAGRRVGLVHVAKATLDAMRDANTISGDSMYVVNTLDVRRVPVGKRGLPHLEVKVTPLEEAGEFSRRLYIEALEWRPPARRGPAFLTGWPSYSAYIEALHNAADSVREVAIDTERMSAEPLELDVYVSAPSGYRYDPDNVALFACDLLTVILSSRGMIRPVDWLVDRVVISHGEGEHSVTLEIRPLQN